MGGSLVGVAGMAMEGTVMEGFVWIKLGLSGARVRGDITWTWVYSLGLFIGLLEFFFLLFFCVSVPT